MAVTSWCQNCPVEGQNRDSNSTCELQVSGFRFQVSGFRFGIVGGGRSRSDDSQKSGLIVVTPKLRKFKG
jgi:hypothetical protein